MLCLFVLSELLREFVTKQLATAETRQKREEETTTENILESIKTGIETTFSEQNVKNVLDKFNDFGDKAKDLGMKIFSNVQNALKTDEASTSAP